MDSTGHEKSKSVMYWCYVSLLLRRPEDGTSAPKHVGIFKTYLQYYMCLLVYVIDCKSNHGVNNTEFKVYGFKNFDIALYMTGSKLERLKNTLFIILMEENSTTIRCHRHYVHKLHRTDGLLTANVRRLQAAYLRITKNFLHLNTDCFKFLLCFHFPIYSCLAVLWYVGVKLGFSRSGKNIHLRVFENRALR